MTSIEKEAACSADASIQHTETGAGTIQIDPKNTPPTVRSHSASDLTEAPPPDGGLRAWIQVMGCFFLVG